MIADWTPDTVVFTSFATVAIATFITDVSSVIRNCADGERHQDERRRGHCGGTSLGSACPLSHLAHRSGSSRVVAPGGAVTCIMEFDMGAGSLSRRAYGRGA